MSGNESSVEYTASMSVSGEMDHDNADEVLDRFKALLPAVRAAGGGRVLVDCSELEFCDSSGLAALLMARREAEACAAVVTLARVSGPVAELLVVAGVDGLFELVQTARPAQDGPPRPALDGRTASSRGGARLCWAGAVPVLHVYGQVDVDCSDLLKEAFDEAVGAADGRVVIDVSRLEFADSTLLHLLLRAREFTDLRLVGPLQPEVRLLLEATDLLPVFRFADTIDTALD